LGGGGDSRRGGKRLGIGKKEKGKDGKGSRNGKEKARGNWGGEGGVS